MILETSTRQWVLGLESEDDLEKWKTVILKNSVFGRDSGSTSKLGVRGSKASRRWSLQGFKHVVSDYVNLGMGYGKGLQHPMEKPTRKVEELSESTRTINRQLSSPSVPVFNKRDSVPDNQQLP